MHMANIGNVQMEQDQIQIFAKGEIFAKGGTEQVKMIHICRSGLGFLPKVESSRCHGRTAVKRANMNRNEFTLVLLAREKESMEYSTV